MLIQNTLTKAVHYVPATLEGMQWGQEFTVNHFLVISIEVQGMLSWKTHEQEQKVLSV